MFHIEEIERAVIGESVLSSLANRQRSGERNILGGQLKLTFTGKNEGLVFGEHFRCANVDRILQRIGPSRQQRLTIDCFLFVKVVTNGLGYGRIEITQAKERWRSLARWNTVRLSESPGFGHRAIKGTRLPPS